MAAALAALPLAVKVPAIASAAAYLDAKHAIRSDWHAFSTAVYARILLKIAERKDRVNAFYRFEDQATSSWAATRTFIVTPPQELGAQTTGEKTEWTYAEAYDIVLRYANWLKTEHHVQKNEIVAFDCTNRPYFIFVWLALWSLGAKPAFINSNLRDKAFVHCVSISTARLLIIDGEIQDALNEETRSQLGPDEKGQAVEAVILDKGLRERIPAYAPYRADDSERSGELLKDSGALIYTSGTTGLPKAANVSWNKPNAASHVFGAVIGLKSHDRFFTAMPLYHSTASMLGVWPVIGTGCTLIVAPKFSPRTYMYQIAASGATVMQYIGEACRYLVSSPATPYDRAHSLRLAVGNGMRPDGWGKFKDRFNIDTICEFYGATEAPTISYVNSRNSFLQGSIGRVGTVLSGLQSFTNAVVQYDTDLDLPKRDPLTNFCTRCKTNETGELLIKMDPEAVNETYQGYLNNSKATESKLLRNVFVKGDVWYRTGDLQRFDEEGRWWFMDRIGDTFRWKGENVSTAEVSEVLGRHPKVKEANAYGVQLPGHDGRAGCAAIVLESGDRLDGALAAELAASVQKQLPRYAVPIFLRLVQEVEVTGTMKHQKVVLRNDGVDPKKVSDPLYWLGSSKGAGSYVPFGEKEWKDISEGQVKL